MALYAKQSWTLLLLVLVQALATSASREDARDEAVQVELVPDLITELNESIHARLDILQERQYKDQQRQDETLSKLDTLISFTKYQRLKNVCEEKNFTFSNRHGWCVQYQRLMFSWPDARDNCKKDGADLMTVDSVEKQVFLDSLSIKDWWSWAWSAGSVIPDENKIVWIATGEELEYTNWAPNEPVPYGDCVLVSMSNNTERKGWRRSHCSNTYQSLCEIVI